MTLNTRGTPSKADIEAIAIRNPCLAYELLVYGKQKQIYTASVSIDSGGVTGNPLPAAWQNPTAASVYVYDFAYSVATPQANAGLLGRSSEQYYNAKIPGIDAKIYVTGGMSGSMAYMVNQDVAGMEGLARHVDNPGGYSPATWADGWLIPWACQVNIEHFLRRTYAQGELPVVCTWYFYTAWIGAAYQAIGEPKALEFLAGLGYQVPKERPQLRPRDNG